MSMANVKNSPLKIRHGLVAFFDILGFRKMIGSNESGEMHAIVRDILHPILEKVVRIELTTYRLDSSYLAISDSILVYQAQEEQVPGVSDETVAHCFIRSCCVLTADLLSAGLPARGAISKGEFSIIPSVDGKYGHSFTGKCIVEAYELSEKLQLAACAVAPAAELAFLAGDKVKKSFHKELFHWPTSVKGSPPKQKLMLLNYADFFRQKKQISRATLIECFGMHKKDVNLEVLPKIENTFDFLKEGLKLARKSKVTY